MRSRSAIVLLLALSGAALAQPGQPAVPPPTRAVPVVPEKPVEVAAPVATTKDAEIRSILEMLTGSFKAPASGTQPDLTLHTAIVNVDGLDNAVYFEIGRADTPQSAFSSGIFHLFRQRMPGGKDELRLRVFSLDRVGPTFAAAMHGLWLAPDMFPLIKAERLLPLVDVPLTRADDGGYTGTSTPSPTNQHGATLVISGFQIQKGRIVIDDRGVKADGASAFGGAAPVFTPYESGLAARRLTGGLVTIDLVAGTGEAASDGDEIAVQYTGWLAADGLQFDTSRQEGRQPLLFSLPASLIQGWNLGVPGIQRGTVRRMIIPAAMGYGESGRRSARIPPNATLVFETECVYLKDNPPPPPPEQVKVEGEGAPAGEQPKPK